MLSEKAFPRYVPAVTLVEGFVRALAEAEEPRLGDCWASALRHYFDAQGLAELKPTRDWYPPSIFFQGMKFMLFGDPTLPLPPARGAPGGADLRGANPGG